MPVVSVLLHVLRQFVPFRSSGQESIAPVVWPHDLLPTLRTQLCLHWWPLHHALTADSFTRGGGREGYKRDHTIFRRKKGGISRNWEPQRGYHWKLWKDSEGGPLKFAWKLSHGGITKVIKSYKGGSLQWSKIQRGEKLNFTLFSPKSPAPPLSPPPPPHHAINNDRSLKARELARDPDVLISVSYSSPRLPPASTTFLSQTVRS